MVSRYQQRKRAYTNILMFIGLMAMAMVAWLDHQNKLPERRASNQPTTAPVSLVAFINSNGVNNELRRKDQQWTLMAPVEVAARTARVGRLLELQEIDFSAGFAIDSVNVTAARLDEQARVLQLDNNIYRFGGIEPVSKKRYVQLNDKVVLLEDRYLPLMDGGVNAFAELQLPLQQVSSVTVNNVALDSAQLLAWEDTQAMGVRAAAASIGKALPITIERADSTPTTWLAWPEQGLWVLQAKSQGIDYLISAAQAATLGLISQP